VPVRGGLAAVNSGADGAAPTVTVNGPAVAGVPIQLSAITL